MAELTRLSGRSEWIELDVVERERTPSRLLKWVFSCIWPACRFRIQNSILEKWVSNTVEPLFTTG